MGTHSKIKMLTLEPTMDRQTKKPVEKRIESSESVNRKPAYPHVRSAVHGHVTDGKKVRC
jgi:hypothetical protein